MRILHRRGKASEWLAANPILAAGEIGIEFSDENPVTIAIKAGDGTRHWVNLPYAVGSGEGGGGGVSLTAVDILAALLGVDGPGSALDADTLDGLHAEDITTMASLVANNEATNAIASLSSVYQPLDSDLSAIAALSTTSFGRSLLTLADATAVRSVLSLGTAATQAATSFEAAGTIATHSADTTDVHGIADTASLVVTTDGRLSNARTPTAHASTHAAAGSDPIAITAAQVTSGTLDIARIPAAVATDAEVTAAIAALSTVYQPIDSDLTAIAALATTTFGRSLLTLADAAAGRSVLGLGTAATQPSSAFDAAGAAAAAQAASQPLDSDLTAIASLTTTVFGRAVLALADAAAARTHLGLGGLATLSAVTSAEIVDGTIVNADIAAAAAIAASKIAGLATIATSGSAADLASGTVPTARLGSGTADGTKFLRGDQTWAAAGGGGGNAPIHYWAFGARNAAGDWFNPCSIGLGLISRNLPSSAFMCAPFGASASWTITDVAVLVSATGTATNARVWLYELAPPGSPGVLVGDSGNFSVSTTGAKSVSGLSWAVSAGKAYALGVVADGTVSLSGWYTNDWMSASNNVGILNRHLRDPYFPATYGSAPSTFTFDLTRLGVVGTDSSLVSFVAIRVSGVS